MWEKLKMIKKTNNTGTKRAGQYGWVSDSIQQDFPIHRHVHEYVWMNQNLEIVVIVSNATQPNKSEQDKLIHVIHAGFSVHSKCVYPCKKTKTDRFTMTFSHFNNWFDFWLSTAHLIYWLIQLITNYLSNLSTTVNSFGQYSFFTTRAYHNAFDYHVDHVNYYIAKMEWKLLRERSPPIRSIIIFVFWNLFEWIPN